MEYLDFDLEIELVGGRDYRVVVHSSAGEARATMRFPFDEVALGTHLDKLQIALLRSGGLRRRVLTVEEQTVQDFGGSLFEALIAGDVRALYDVSRARAAQEGRPGVRLRLRILDPALAALPWEYLYDARQSAYLCLSRGTPLVRYPEMAQPMPPLRVIPPLRILGMTASPSGLPTLDVEREQVRLREALKDLEAAGLVKLEWLPGQTWRHLQRAMRGGPWHIFHFIGHGGFDEQSREGVLALADDVGKASLLSATQLGYLLANHDPLRLVILNACEGGRSDSRDLFSSSAAALARRGLPAVLAMQYEITDRAAIECTRAFYEALADGLPVDAALAEARTAIHVGVNNSLEWGTPVLYMRAPDGFLFDVPTRLIERREASSTPPEPPPGTPLVTLPPAIGPAPTSAVPQQTKEQLPKEGDALVHYPAKRLGVMFSAYEDAIKLDPNYAPAYYSSQGEALNELKRYEERLAVSGRAIRLNPRDARAYNSQGNALWYLKRYEESLTTFEKAIQLNPMYAVAYHNKGSALWSLGRYEESRTAFERAIQLDPAYALVHNGIGCAFYDLKHYTSALTTFEQAIQLDPTDGLFYYNQGRALKALGRAGAEQAYQKARELGYRW